MIMLRQYFKIFKYKLIYNFEFKQIYLLLMKKPLFQSALGLSLTTPWLASLTLLSQMPVKASVCVSVRVCNMFLIVADKDENASL